MFFIALKMLMGDTTKYVALCFGLAFSVTLVMEQGAIVTGVLKRTASTIENVPQADIWVMHPATQYYDERRAITSTAVNRVRGVEGVEWAEPLFTGGGSATLPDGSFANVQIVGVDRVSKLGLPRLFVSGKPDMIEQADTIFWDDGGIALYKKIKPNDVLEINDHRAKVVGQVSAPRRFSSAAVIYTTYERALQYSPGERNMLSFVLVKVKPGFDHKTVASHIAQQTGLGAHTGNDFYWSTVAFYLKNSAIPINFGVTVLLGIIVGIAIAGQTFYSFTAENIRHFGSLKAMGTSNGTLIRMVLLQALLVGLIGWGLGAGAAAVFGWNLNSRSAIAFLMTPHLMIFSFVNMLVTVLIAAVISIRRVLNVEPAIVFR